MTNGRRTERIARGALPPIAVRQLVRFSLLEDLSTGDASATADIVEQFGAGAEHGVTEGIVVRNYETSTSDVYRWEGSTGAVGLALWIQGNEYVIIDLECP